MAWDQIRNFPTSGARPSQSTLRVAGAGLPCALAGGLEYTHSAARPDELQADAGSAVGPWSREAGIVRELDCWEGTF